MSFKSFVTRRLFLGTQIQLIVLALSLIIAGAVITGNNFARSLGTRYSEARVWAAKMDDLASLTLAIKEMQFAVLGIQEDVSHFSATYDSNHDDLVSCLEEADQFTVQFNASAEKASTLLANLDLPKVKSTVKEVEDEFPGYLASGKDVAASYFKNGPQLSVSQMKHFDELGDDLVGDASNLFRITHAETDAAKAAISEGSTVVATWIASFQWFLAVTSVGVVATVAVIMIYAYYGIASPLRQLVAVMHALARGNSYISDLKFDRADEIGLLAHSVDAVRRAAIETSRQEAALRLAQWRDLSDATVEGLVVCDGDQLVTANRSFEQMVGRGLADLASLTVPQIFRDPSALGRLRDDEREAVELELACANDETLPVEVLIKEISYLGKPCRLLAFRDLRERRKAEEQVKFLARRDPLTGLANRHWFGEEMDIALRRTGRNQSVAVMCLDLDQFKGVNDSLGHPVGDALLQTVANRIKQNVRQEDVVARMGGDEFSIIQIGAAQPEGATTLAKRLIEIISEPYEIDGHHVVVGTSIGISIAPNDGNEAHELLKNADLALYRAKTEGRGIYRMFERGMDERARARRNLEGDLRKALSLNQFELFYQPQVEATTRTVKSFEALLRWRHPERGLVAPLDFIPVAEEIGLMGGIGEWVLRQACKDALSWPDNVGVAVNISATQFRNNPLEEHVRSALDASGLSSQRLELEITESVLLENTEPVIEILGRLRASGIRIAMDDFGTGYSSLSYLSRFPIDKIKIDRSFVKGTASDDSALAVVRAVVGLTGSLGMTSTAEGVETLEQLTLLQSEGCGEVQGYLFSRPIPVSGVPELLRSLSIQQRHAA